MFSNTTGIAQLPAALWTVPTKIRIPRVWHISDGTESGEVADALEETRDEVVVESWFVAEACRICEGDDLPQPVQIVTTETATPNRHTHLLSERKHRTLHHGGQVHLAPGLPDHRRGAVCPHRLLPSRPDHGRHLDDHLVVRSGRCRKGQGGDRPEWMRRRMRLRCRARNRRVGFRDSRWAGARHTQKALARHFMRMRAPR